MKKLELLVNQLERLDAEQMSEVNGGIVTTDLLPIIDTIEPVNKGLCVNVGCD